MKKFCEESSIHGVQFLNKSEGQTTKKLGIFLYLLSLIIVGFLMHKIYVRWQVDPVIIEELNSIPMRELPFPAITICSPLFTRDNLPNIKNILNNKSLVLSSNEQNHLAANIHACAPNLARSFNFESQENLILTLKSKHNSINDILSYCEFRVFKKPCDRLFNYVPTDKGFCLSFNMEGFSIVFNKESISDDFKAYERKNIALNYALAAANTDQEEMVNDETREIVWTMEGGYTNDSELVHPARASRLTILYTVAKINNSDLTNLCPESGKTFTVFFHLPIEILTPLHEPKFVHLGIRKNLVLTAKSYKTNENLKSYHPLKRGCYFQREKSLKFFKSYTKLNCEFECMSNYTLDKCSCVKFSMPRLNSTPICRVDKISCYHDIMMKWPIKDNSCDCLPSCSEIQYGLHYTKELPYAATKR